MKYSKYSIKTSIKQVSKQSTEYRANLNALDNRISMQRCQVCLFVLLFCRLEAIWELWQTPSVFLKLLLDIATTNVAPTNEVSDEAYQPFGDAFR